jgi:hypothetical protein
VAACYVALGRVCTTRQAKRHQSESLLVRVSPQGGTQVGHSKSCKHTGARSQVVLHNTATLHPPNHQANPLRTHHNAMTVGRRAATPRTVHETQHRSTQASHDSRNRVDTRRLTGKVRERPTPQGHERHVHVETQGAQRIEVAGAVHDTRGGQEGLSSTGTAP